MIDFGQLGDVVLSLPVLRRIRERFSEARITVLAGRVPSEAVEISGLVDEVIAIDRVELRDGPKLRSIAALFRLVYDIRRRGFDLVIDLHSLPETNILAFLSTAKYRLLANRESRSLDLLSNFRPRPPKEDKPKHLTLRYGDVLKPLRIPEPTREFQFQLVQEAADFVDHTYFTETDRETVGLFPGAGHPSRRWSLENFAALAKLLDEDGYRPAVFLGPEEKRMRGEISAIFPANSIVIEGLSISRFLACSARLAAFVTNDTGPMHLAACAGVPIVLLLDGRAPATYLPLTKRLKIVRNQTIDQIQLGEVYAATKELI